MDFSVILIIAIVVLCVIFYSIYVKVIKSKNKVEEAVSSVDVQLKKRYDLIPNILELAAKFLSHEKSLLEEIVQLRNKALNTKSDLTNMNKKIKLDGMLDDKMSQLMLSFENYPELKSNETIIMAMQTYNEVEGHIAAARRFYNSAVLELNNCVDIFPSSILASLMNIQKQEYFKISEKERQVIQVKDFIK